MLPCASCNGSKHDNNKKKNWENEKNNTTLKQRVEISFWTLLISSKRDDIQQWWMIFLIMVSFSRDRWRKGAVTPIEFILKNLFRTFWNVSSSVQIDSSCNLVWISKSAIPFMFPSFVIEFASTT